MKGKLFGEILYEEKKIQLCRTVDPKWLFKRRSVFFPPSETALSD